MEKNKIETLTRNQSNQKLKLIVKVFGYVILTMLFFFNCTIFLIWEFVITHPFIYGKKALNYLLNFICVAHHINLKQGKY